MLTLQRNQNMKNPDKTSSFLMSLAGGGSSLEEILKPFELRIRLRQSNQAEPGNIVQSRIIPMGV